MGSQKPHPPSLGLPSFEFPNPYWLCLLLAPYVLSPHPLLRPVLGPTPTFDGGVDEDDTAHGR